MHEAWILCEQVSHPNNASFAPPHTSQNKSCGPVTFRSVRQSCLKMETHTGPMEVSSIPVHSFSVEHQCSVIQSFHAGFTNSHNLLTARCLDKVVWQDRLKINEGQIRQQESTHDTYVSNSFQSWHNQSFVDLALDSTWAYNHQALHGSSSYMLLCNLCYAHSILAPCRLVGVYEGLISPLSFVIRTCRLSRAMRKVKYISKVHSFWPYAESLQWWSPLEDTIRWHLICSAGRIVDRCLIQSVLMILLPHNHFQARPHHVTWQRKPLIGLTAYY